MTLRSRLTLVALISAAAALAAPVAAQATVYCVDPATSPGCTPESGFQEALDEAAANVGLDTIELGAQTYSPASLGGFVYQPPDTDPVEIVGAGQGQTVIGVEAPAVEPVNPTDIVGLQLPLVATGSSVSDLTVALPSPTFTSVVPTGSNQNYYGFKELSNDAAIDRVTISSPDAVPISARGIYSQGATQITDSTISLGPGEGAPNFGIEENADNDPVMNVRRTSVTADLTIRYDNPNPDGRLVMDRTRLNPRVQGIEVATSRVEMSNSIIDLGANMAATGADVGFENDNGIFPSSIKLDGVTIGGTGDSQRGVRVHATADNNVPGTDVAMADIANTVIDLRGTAPASIDRADNFDGTATVNYDYTALDPTTIFSSSGAGVIAPGAINAGTHNPAGSVPAAVLDFANGNYRPAPGTALVDAGNPVTPPLGTLDFDGGPRVRDGNADCTGVRDIGAYELDAGPIDCFAPDTQVTGGPAGITGDATPTFTFTANEPATFQCRVDGGAFGACSGVGVHTPPALANGPHLFEVRAVDTSPAQNLDATPAFRNFTVDTAAPDTRVTGPTKFKAKKKSARVSFALSSEPGASFQCSLDNTAFTACVNPFSATARKGAHTLRVRAKDAAGNVDATPASVSFKVVKKKRKRKK